MSASKWKPYPEYKENKMTWIDKIPTTWSLGKDQNDLVISKSLDSRRKCGVQNSMFNVRKVFDILTI